MNNPYNAPAADMSAHGGDLESYEPQVFAMKGRIGRVRYVAYAIGLIMAMSMGMGIVLGFLAAIMGFASSAAFLLVITVVIYVPLLAILFIMAIRRVHDMGYSGWFSLLCLIPLVNFWLLFAPGTKGTNEYGPPPVKNSAGVIVAAVLAVLFMFGGMLAAVAIPAYQGYVQKARAAQEESAARAAADPAAR